MENFDYPYRSTSVREFWRRWHISLSTWFRDYLYIPLGGNRGGGKRTAFNLMVVFLLCGLWHGAAWTFVVWGGWHGLFLVLERTGFGRRLRESRLRHLGHAYTLLVVLIGWVFFRAETLGDAARYLVAMAGLGTAAKLTDYTLALALTPKLTLALVAGAIASFPALPALASVVSRLGVPARVRGLAGFSALAVVFFLSVCLLAAGSHNPFIYFRF